MEYGQVGQTKNAIRVLFDRRGRRIPKELSGSHCDPSGKFYLEQPKLDDVGLASRLKRLHQYLDIDTGITGKDFRKEFERLLAIIRYDSQIANITNGIYLPVVLPQLINDNIGAEMEYYLEAVGKSYEESFDGRSFSNYHKDDLKGEISIADESRHDQLISRLKEGPVIGIYFPNTLQGFSVEAQREQMLDLPEGFFLSGLDTAIAGIMWPDYLFQDYNTPCLDLAALKWRFSSPSLRFGTNNVGKLIFDNWGDLSFAYNFSSGGLLFAR